MIDFPTERAAMEKVTRQAEHLRQTVADERLALKAATDRLARTREAQEITQLLAQAVQQKAHEKISEVVSKCLETVFDSPYRFKIEFDRKRGRTEARLRFTRGDLDLDPLTASGGGAVDVASFALRVSCLMLHRPRLRKLIVADEPFRYVSREYLPNVCTMLEALAADLKLQIVMVTHIPELETGKVFEI